MTDVINTKRFILRPLHTTDAAAVVAGVGDLEVSRWLTHPPHPYAYSDAMEFIKRNEERFPNVSAVEVDGEFQGVVSLDRELGYWMSKHAWGKGYTLEASKVLIDHHFQTTDAASVSSGYFIGNTRSRKILEILGFANLCIETVTPKATGLEVRLQKMHLPRERWEAVS